MTARCGGPQFTFRCCPLQYRARSMNFCIFPVTVRGSISAKSTEVGHLKWARPARQCAISSASVAASPVSMTIAFTVSPQRGSGTAMACQGYDWAYALNGTLRLVLGEHDLILRPGEAAESDTRTPHWFGATSAGPVEYLSLIGKQGERAHVRAAPRHGPAE
jgi:mannose-6-phosphate isomerase-like protein (cupin superfamily)